MAWDQKYRRLEEGEIIRATDDVQRDDGTWERAQGGVGRPAPSPNYTSHRVYRRRKGYVMEQMRERVARAMAKAHGLDFDEICGADADPDEGYCDSSTCVAAYYEEHDADMARDEYLHQADAALSLMQPEIDRRVAEEKANLESKFRCVVSHATGGNFQDIDASLNEISVRISQFHTQLWEQARQSGAKEEKAKLLERLRTPSDAACVGLARDIMMWLDMEPKTPRALFKHLERIGREIPQWLRDEPEMQSLDHVPSKATRCAIIWQAMLTAFQQENRDER